MIKIKFHYTEEHERGILYKNAEVEAELVEVSCGDTSILLFSDDEADKVCVAPSEETTALSIAGTSEKYITIKTKDVKK